MPKLSQIVTQKRDAAARRQFHRAAERATRRRALPRWILPVLRVVAVLAVIGGIGGGGALLWRSGLAQGFAEGFGGTVIRATALAGFRVDEVLVAGRSGAEKQDLLNAIKLQRGDPILGFSLSRAQAELQRLPWIAAATVERRLPNLVYIRIVEREPMALWQFDRKVVVIDKVGNILADQGFEHFSKLPIIVGKGAPEHAPELLLNLANEPILSPHLAAAIWVGSRRWDLRLDNGINVRLPEYDYAGALRRLSDLVSRESLFDRDIVAIDLRLPDRLIVQTAESGLPHKKVSGEKI
ncbi:MAG: cell division protein FtsQ/DivIB [Rhodospirillaceae bacterium]